VKSPFTAGEVRALAESFGIEGGALFEYMNSQYAPAADWRPRDVPDKA